MATGTASTWGTRPAAPGGGATASGVPSAASAYPGNSGHQCELEVPEYSFDGRSHVHFQLGVPRSPPAGPECRFWFGPGGPAAPFISLLSKEQNEYLHLEMLQGLLAVFYNLGDGDYSLTLPSHRLDDGEEVTAAPGRSREIVIDPTVVILGNSLPSSHNKSFQGCMQDLRLNGRYVALDSQTREGATLVSSQGVSVGCSSDSCRRNRCSPPFTCVDLWRVHECRCPPGHMVQENGTGRFCEHTPCAGRPCHRGTCASHSPSNFTCHCPQGYRGRRCEVTLAIYRDDVGLSFSSLFAICICFLALLVLLLGIFLWTRWRSYKGLKEGVYHVSAHHDGWEDIRENVLNYDEEGGGEEDQNAYDMAELQKSLQPSPAQSVQYSHARGVQHHPHAQQDAAKSNASTSSSSTAAAAPASAGASASATISTSTLRRDVPPPGPSPQGPPLPMHPSRKSLSFSSQDLARYLCEIIRDAEHHLDTAPFDSLQVFSTEGGGSPAGSLSSFSSAGLDDDRAPESLRDWGPRFEKLKALYERAEGSDL
ncbi:hypothetical protein SKAU_G00354360 [Synaphobranchus kaupii]|uniref:Neural-cadherin n=1 Tax=Synaphobranchus kaupii TaxID=118154 RepID=A0A9Q1EH35_SYNKA|nr:hypothetical protein SKAU_G00354360 [Synaphobranchus kaupii]